MGARRQRTAQQHGFGLLAAVVLPIALIAAACTGGSAATPGSAVTSAPRTFAPTLVPTPLITPYGALPSELPAGRFDVPELGFGITLAPGWRAFPLEDEAMARILEDIDPESPFGELLDVQLPQQNRTGVQFWALDTRAESIVGGFTPNLNVIFFPREAMTATSFAESLRADFVQADQVQELSEVAPIDLPAGNAAMFTFEIAITPPGAAMRDVLSIWVVIEAGAEVMALTINCSIDVLDPCVEDGDRMLPTIRLL